MRTGGRLCRCVLGGLSAALCLVQTASAAVGESPRAMSPNPTSQSYGARLEETALGSFVADGMRESAGTDIAIECGGHLVNSLPGGAITEEDVRRVFAGDVEILRVELTCPQLFDLLEFAVGAARIDGAERLDAASGGDCFPQISGFSLEFDVSQLPGRRVRRVELDGAGPIRREEGRTLTAALPRDLLDGTLGYRGLEALAGSPVGRQGELLVRYVRAQGRVDIPAGGRIAMVGSSDGTLYESLSLGTLLPYLLLAAALLRLLWRRRGGTNNANAWNR